MTTFHFQTHVSESGVMALPPLPETFYGENVTVNVDVKTPPHKCSFEELCGVWGNEEECEDIDRMVSAIHESRKSFPPVEITDEEIEHPRKERRQRIVAEHSRIADQTPEEWQTAVDDFMTSWKGCLKGTPHMTAKEIRAERLEKKYGQHGGQE